MPSKSPEFRASRPRRATSTELGGTRAVWLGIWCARARQDVDVLGLAAALCLLGAGTPRRPGRARGAAALRGPLDHGCHRPRRPAARSQRGRQAPSYYPSAFGFGADDADFSAPLASTPVRLGVDFRGLMPTPGSGGVTGTSSSWREVKPARTARVSSCSSTSIRTASRRSTTATACPTGWRFDDGLPDPPMPSSRSTTSRTRRCRGPSSSLWANRPGPGRHRPPGLLRRRA